MRPKHLDDAAKALDVKLTPEDISYLEEPYVPHRIVGAIDHNPAEGVMLLDEKKYEAVHMKNVNHWLHILCILQKLIGRITGCYLIISYLQRGAKIKKENQSYEFR